MPSPSFSQQLRKVSQASGEALTQVSSFASVPDSTESASNSSFQQADCWVELHSTPEAHVYEFHSEGGCHAVVKQVVGKVPC